MDPVDHVIASGHERHGPSPSGRCSSICRASTPRGWSTTLAQITLPDHEVPADAG